MAADLVGRFETQLQLAILLAFVIPGIVYLTDAVGTQTEFHRNALDLMGPSMASALAVVDKRIDCSS